MADRTTDGTGTGAGDPGTDEAWDRTFTEAMASEGFDANVTLGELDDPAASPSQSDAESSAPAPVEPVATPREPAGDIGTGTPGTPVAAPAAPLAPPAVPPDPTGTPFTFEVNGQRQTIESVRHFPGEGLYVPEDQVPAFQQMAGRAETLGRQVRDLSDQTTAWERASAWKLNPGQATERTITGLAGLAEARASHARAIASLNTLHDAITNRPADLVTPQQDPTTGEWVLAPNPQALAHLMRDAELAAIKAEGTARAHLSAIAAPPPPAPPSIADVAGVTVESYVQAHGIAGLTEADKRFLVGQLPRYVEQTKTGPAVNATFLDVMKDRAALRAEAVQQAKAAADASAFNSRMTGGRSAPKAPVRPTAPPATAPPEKVGKAASWDAVLRAGMEGIDL